MTGWKRLPKNDQQRLRAAACEKALESVVRLIGTMSIILWQMTLKTQ